MDEIIIKGHSDDIVGFRGVISDEVYVKDDSAVIVTSSGTVVKMTYNHNGCWDAKVIAKGDAEVSVVLHDNDNTCYSDVVTVKGKIDWVSSGEFFPK
jgi:hypothetical protein